MERASSPFEYELLNHLTTVRLALEVLQRRPDLCTSEAGLLDRAVWAVDQITASVRNNNAATS